MKKLYTRFITNKIYLLLLLGWVGMGTTSCTTYTYYSPNGGTFSGQTGYCVGATAGVDSFNYTQCMAGDASGFFVVPNGASGTVQWYYNTTGSTVPATSTALGGVTAFSSPSSSAGGTITYTPLTTSTGTYYYFADMTWSGSSYCSNELITSAQAITISPAISPITGGASTICEGTTTTFSDASSGGTWASTNPSVGTISSSGVVTSIDSGSLNVSYTVGGCTITTPLSVSYTPPAPVVTPSTTTVCDSSSVMLTASVAPTLSYLIPVNSFESGVPGTGWSESGGGTSYLYQVDAPSSIYPSVPAAEDGTYFLEYDSYDAPSGTNANIYSPSFSLAGISGATITFWVYRDYGSLYTGSSFATEGVTVHINTVTAVGGTTLGFVPRAGETAITGTHITGTSTVTASGWYQYTCTVPAAYAGYGTATNYVLFHFHSAFGDNCYLDNVAVMGLTPTTPPVWSPATYLFTDAALTTPYVTGTPADTVYSYPTGVTATTVETYTATETAGSCSATDTAQVTIYNPTGSISVASTSVCAGGNTVVTFTSSAAAVMSYHIGSGSTLTATIGAAGTATVSTGSLTSSVTYYLTSIAAGSCSSSVNDSVVITVNPPAHTITGDSSVCIGAVNTLSATPTGGTWSSSAAATATIGASSGVLRGIASGSAQITYIAPTTGCIAVTTATVNPLPSVFSITGGGTSSYCSGGLGIDLGLGGSASDINYQLYNGASTVGSAVSGTGSAITFGYQTTSGTYSVLATNASTGCTNPMSGTATIVINALPALFTVTGGGAYCSGGAGEHIGLSGSATGISYQLYDGASTIGSAVAGTGSALDFGVFFGAGTYSVIATNTTTSCTRTMTGTVTIVVNPLPGLFSVTGGGSYCSGGTGELVGLSGSATGINYQLYDTTTTIGTAVAGTGAAFNFGSETAPGTYSVVATNATTGCKDTMLSSVPVAIYPLPTAYTVIGSGSYCAGGAGLDITLSSSDTGISYQLYYGGSAVGAPLVGTGSPLDFGNYTPAGPYTVRATNNTTGCINTMTGSAVIVINPLPTVYAMTGGGAYCYGGAGVPIGLTGSQAGISYQLYDSTAPVGAPVAGTGSPASFGLETVAGTAYTVQATNTATGCVSNMTGVDSVIVNILVPDSVSVVPGPLDTVCIGTAVTFTATPYGGGTSPTYQWSVNSTILPASGNIFTYTPSDGDIVTSTMTSSFPCGVPASPSYAVNMTVLPYGYPAVSIAAAPVYSVCEGSPVTFTPTPVFGGFYPVYSWIVNGSIYGTGTTFAYDPLNRDTVTAILSSDYQCRLADSAVSNKKIMHVIPLSVPSLEILVSPSPSLAIGQTATFTAIVTNGGTSPTYQWFAGNTAITSATGSTFTTSALGAMDSVSCLVTNSGTCAGITTFNWAIIREYPEGVQPVLVQSSDIKLLPNPNSGTFTLKGYWALTDNTDATLSITDMLGHEVYTNTVKTLQGQMNERVFLGNTLANGVYMLTIHRGEEYKVFRFVIEQ